MNPLRPTPARITMLIRKLDRVILDIEKMTSGNVKSSDQTKLDKLRRVRDSMVADRWELLDSLPKEGLHA